MARMTQSLEDYLEAVYVLISSGRPAQVHDVAKMLSVKMPSVVKAIRELKDPKLANIPVVACSANAFEEDVQASLNAGMDGHLAKPIEIDDMKKMLAHLL